MENTKYTTNLDTMDVEAFQQIEETAHVAETLRQKHQEHESFSDLMADGFGAFHKFCPTVKAEVAAERKLNKTVMEQMMALNEYKQLRNFTTGDAENSIGALPVLDQAWQSIPQDVKDAQRDLEQNVEALDDVLGGDDFNKDAVKKAIDKIKQAEAELDKQMTEYADEIRQGIRKAVAKAEADAADGEAAMGALGWGRGDGKMEQTPPKEKLAIANALKNNKKIRDIIQMAGRMTNLAQKKQRQKAQYFRTEVVGVEQGNDLPTVLPSEFAYLMHDNPAVKMLFLKRYSQSELMQYEMEDREPKAQGPVLVLIDCSGSMGGDPDTWSKACALAMYSIARKQRRDFGMLLFNTSVVKEVFVKKGEHKASDLLDIIGAGVGGGTSFETPLGRAMELIGQETHNKADLIVITDGICDISETFRGWYQKVKAEKQFSTYTILIGGSTREEQIAKKFSDTTTLLYDNLTKNENESFDIIFNI